MSPVSYKMNLLVDDNESKKWEVRIYFPKHKIIWMSLKSQLADISK